MTVGSPWHWFCSTRTLSNCLETTYTIVALESWPWQWSLAWKDRETAAKEDLQQEDSINFADEVSKYVLLSVDSMYKISNLYVG